MVVVRASRFGRAGADLELLPGPTGRHGVSMPPEG